MRINNNITAVNSHRQLGINQRSLGVHTERLSSGMRVNRAADDSAGLAISEKMRTQIRGLNRASLNVQDGASLLQVGDGALQFIHDKMQRMRELSVQAANGTNADLDRAAIQLEIAQLTSEINSAIGETNFNGKTLFDGSIGSNRAFDFGVEATAYDPGLVEGGAPNFPAGGVSYFPWTAPATFGTQLATGLSALNAASNFPTSGLFAIQVRTPAAGNFTFVLDFEHANPGGTMTGTEFQAALEGLINQAPALSGTTLNIGFGANQFQLNFPRHPDNPNALVGAMGQPGTQTPSVQVGIGMGGGPGALERASMNEGVMITNRPGGAAAIRPVTVADPFNGPATAIFGTPGRIFPQTAGAGPHVGMTINVNPTPRTINLQPGLFPDLNSFVAAQAPAFAAAGFDVSIENGQLMLTTHDTGAHVTFATPVATSTPVDLVNWLGLGDAVVTPSEPSEADGLWIQSGANAGDGLFLDIPRLCARSLGIAVWPLDFTRDPTPVFPNENMTVNNFFPTPNVEPVEPPPSPWFHSLSVMSIEDASFAIDALDNAINIISMERAQLGAQYNRLEYTRANVDNTAENLAAAESRIRDTDMALEMTHFVRGQILTQSSTAMLAQANALPQSMLQLLG